MFIYIQIKILRHIITILTIIISLSSYAEKQKKPAYLLKAEKYYQQNKFDQALELLVSAKQDKTITIEGLQLISLCHIQKNDDELAIQSIKETLDLDKKNEKSYLLWGMIYDQKQDYQRSKTIYETSLQYLPQSIPLLHELGMTLLSLNQSQDGLSYLEKAFTLEPDNDELAIDLAYAYVQEKQFQKAEALLEKVLKKNSQQKEAWYLIAKTYIHQKKSSQAISAMKNSLRFGYKNHQVYHDLALLYIQEQKSDLAIQILIDEQDVIGENDQSSLTLAKLYFQEKQYQKALEYFEKFSKNIKTNNLNNTKDIKAWIQKTKSMIKNASNAQ